MKLQALNTAHTILSKQLDEIVIKLQAQQAILAKFQLAIDGERKYVDTAESSLRGPGSLGAHELSGVCLIKANHEGNKARISQAITQVEARILDLGFQRDELLRRCKAMELLVNNHHRRGQREVQRNEQRLLDEWTNLREYR
ncbi:hypothetical protein [uncultured Umboniibacter sp.]|uniref:hypothetical protein n=1 Tax=uncultured Umboniibacter sp. TaxID=1798917 RepID=UPI00263067A9|nr:hypothetical protein [uncultured Umboniibacter sp.]